MDRAKLLDKLRVVAPALSENALIPVLTHFWLLGERVMAYNDQIAVSTPLKSEFRGAVPGTLLIELLNASNATDIEFLSGEDDKGEKLPDSELLIVAAKVKSRLRVPFLPSSATKIFEMPKPDKQMAMGVDTAAFMKGIETCLRSVREDTSIPDSLGVTIIPAKSGFEMYSTNDATVSHSYVKLKNEPKFKKRVVLSGTFCRQMIELAKDEKAAQLEVHDDYALFVAGDTLLFGKLVNVTKPLDFGSILDEHFPVAAEKEMVKIPETFEKILDRAVIMTETKTGRSKTEISIKGGRIHFHSTSERGTANDETALPDHPDVSVTIEPKLLRAGYGSFDKIIFSENAVVMSRGDSIYMISASS